MFYVKTVSIYILFRNVNHLVILRKPHELTILFYILIQKHCNIVQYNTYFNILNF